MSSLLYDNICWYLNLMLELATLACECACFKIIKTSILVHMDISEDSDSGRKKVDTINKYQVSIFGEDHTLLNVLKYVINKKHSEVELCGYVIPHPSEDMAIFRLQFQDEEQQKADNIYNVIVDGLLCVEQISQKLLSELKSWK